MQFSRHRAAQIAVGVLILIVIRSLAEFLRLYEPGLTRIGPELMLYIYGALAAALSALAVLILHAFNRDLTAIVLAASTILGLLAYKMMVTL